MILNILSVCISTLALLISIYFSFFTSRPHIKIVIEDCVHSIPSKLVCVAFKYFNKSPIAGDISNASICFEGNTLYCITKNEQFDLSTINLQRKGGNILSQSLITKNLPFTALPFSCDTAIICFNVDTIVNPIKALILKIYFVSGRTKRFKLRPILMTAPKINKHSNYQERNEA